MAYEKSSWKRRVLLQYCLSAYISNKKLFHTNVKTSLNVVFNKYVNTNFTVLQISNKCSRYICVNVYSLNSTTYMLSKKSPFTKHIEVVLLVNSLIGQTQHIFERPKSLNKWDYWKAVQRMKGIFNSASYHSVCFMVA